MTTATHEEIAQRASQLWKERGCPAGADQEIWLEAERQLTDSHPLADVSKPTPAAASAASETAAESVVEYHISPAVSEQEAIKAALQKQEARAPQVPHHTGPKSKPAETGKPLWDKPHSS